MTDDWKSAVRRRLGENQAASPPVYPRDQTELAIAIGVHKTAITKMFKAHASKLVEPVCRVLRLDPPMQEATPDPTAVALVRRLSPDQQDEVEEFVRRYILRSNR